MTVYYEKHPISEERKKELMGKGYKILDIKFAPADWIDPLKTKRKAKAVKNDTRQSTVSLGSTDSE
jgi:hypothetical protein